MIALRSEKGKGALQTIIVIIILFVIVYMMVKFFPTFHKSYKFNEEVKKEARAARGRPGYEDVIKRNLIDKARELELNITRDNIKVELNEAFVSIEVDYYIEVETPVYTFKRHFTPKHENPLF
jgi:flagellar basal body-associated protein FliL